MQRPHRRHTALDAFLRPTYLSKNLDAHAKLTAYFHHFQYLTQRFSPEALESIRSGSIRVHSLDVDGKTYICHLALCDEYSHEGEMRVSLYEGETRIYTTRFSFVPGSLINVADESILLISLMQGDSIGSTRMREVSKVFHEISPQALSFCIVCSIAESLDIGYIACVNAVSQPSSNDAILDKLRRVYDGFMHSIEADGPNNDLYIVSHSKFRPDDRSFDTHDTPLAKRKRKMAKRKMKSDIMDSVRATMMQYLEPVHTAPLAALHPAVAPRQARHICIPVSEVGTLIGTRDSGKIKSAGPGGYLIQGGVYIKLPAGTYRATVRICNANANANVMLEICSSGGRSVLMQKQILDLDVGQHALSILWTLTHECRDVELRMRIEEAAAIEAYSLVIDPLGETPTLPGFSHSRVPFWCKENEPHQAFPENRQVRFPPSSLNTQIGRHTDTAVVSTGNAGRLIFGPYISMSPGRYRITFSLLNHSHAGKIKIDICTSLGQSVLVKKRYPRLEPGPHELHLEWACVDEPHFVEFRLVVDEKSVLEVVMLTLEIIDNDPLTGIEDRKTISKPYRPLYALASRIGGAWRNFPTSQPD